MNQDQVKAMLIRIEEPATDFSVVLSGKKSKLVNGLYKPDTREIILHNRNFASDEQLAYTAIHEYAHHLHAQRSDFAMTGRPHSNEFWAIFHGLLEKAEAAGEYRDVFESNADFTELTRKIRAILPQNGELMLMFGKLVVEAEELCRKHCVRFEDYLDRTLGIPRTTAGAAMKAFRYELPATIGWDAMKLVSGVSDPDARESAIRAFMSGKSQESVKALVKSGHEPADAAERLELEKKRLERTIVSLRDRLHRVESELESLRKRPGA